MTDSSPLGFRHVEKRGLRGMIARWWLRRRVRQICRGLRELD